MTIGALSCAKPHVADVAAAPPAAQALRIPTPSEPVKVDEVLTTRRAVRVIARLSQCWSHAICMRSAPLWAKSVMLEEFRFSSKEVRELDATYFQNDHYYVTRDAQLLVAHHSAEDRASHWVERTGHHWSLWRDSGSRADDNVETLFVLQPGWIAVGPRTTWLKHEGSLRAHKLVLGDGPFVEAHIEKSALGKRMPSAVSEARISVTLVSGEGAELSVALGVTADAEGVAEKIRAILADENGFLLRVATRDVLSGAKVTAEDNRVVVSVPVSVLQASSLLKFAGAYVGAEAEP